MLFYQTSPEDTLSHLSSSPEGLYKPKAAALLKKHGPNEIILKGEPLWRKLVEPFANIFMAVLFLAVLISLWHHAAFDAIIILVIMMASALIYYVQRFSTERILRSLQKKHAQKVTVLRHGEPFTVDAMMLVPGDVIRLSEGDKVPADIRILIADSLRADEAVLTGESIPVSKSVPALSGKKEIYEQKNMLFQGSFVVSGHVTGVVVYTGNQTEFGHIAQLAGKGKSSNHSPVQAKIDILVSRIIMATGGVAIVAFGLSLWRGMEITEALRFVIALSVSAVPESLPVAISVILVLGMRRMAKKRALVRSMNAIETIGVITTIATDKTGTLTKNKLSVQQLWSPSWATQALPATLFQTINRQGAKAIDPLDIALISYTEAKNVTHGSGIAAVQLPFNQAYAMSGAIWKQRGGTRGDTRGGFSLAVKGAPEHIADRSDLTKAQQEEIEEHLKQLTSSGYRVVAVATTRLEEPITDFKQLPKKTKLQFIGLVAVADTLYPSAKPAIAMAQRAGVTVRMITGDHHETAFAIGRQLGLVETRDQVFDSRHMDTLTDAALSKQIEAARVFSRVTPENKFRILQLLKKRNVTAMTGDGVNDVPALSSAHVGVAMGSGSQIAKDAGDIVLLNDNFSSIVQAMREGRIIFANIRRMLFYLLSTNIGEVLTALGALIVGLPMPLVPVQILWINLVTDTTMVIPLGLEPGEKTTMHQKPTPPSAPILGTYMISRIILVAVTMAVMALTLYGVFSVQYGSDYGRTVVFIALVVVQWANAFNARSAFESVFSRVRVWNGAFWVGLSISVILQMLALTGPLQQLLHVHPVSFGDMAFVSAVAFVVAIVVVEIHKFFGRRYIVNASEA